MTKAYAQLVNAKIHPNTGSPNYDVKHEFTDILDVLISTPADNEVLTYEAATALWKNKPVPPGAISYQYVEGTTDWTLTGTTAWTDIAEMSITVAQAGTYLIMWSWNYVATKDVNSLVFDLYLRWLADATELKQLCCLRNMFTNNPVALPFSFNFIRSLTAGQVLKVQARLRNVADYVAVRCASYAYYQRILKIVKLA